jgi:hypothetical protein
MCYAKEVSALWSYALPGPCGAGTSLPGHWGFSLLSALKQDGSGQCSGQSGAAQSRNCGYGTVYCMCIVLISHLVILSFGTSPKWFICIVLIVVFFILSLINHIME